MVGPGATTNAAHAQTGRPGSAGRERYSVCHAARHRQHITTPRAHRHPATPTQPCHRPGPALAAFSPCLNTPRGANIQPNSDKLIAGSDRHERRTAVIPIRRPPIACVVQAAHSLVLRVEHHSEKVQQTEPVVVELRHTQLDEPLTVFANTFLKTDETYRSRGLLGLTKHRTSTKRRLQNILNLRDRHYLPSH